MFKRNHIQMGFSLVQWSQHAHAVSKAYVKEGKKGLRARM